MVRPVSEESKKSFADLISKMNQIEGKSSINEDRLVTSEKKSQQAVTNSRVGNSDSKMKNIIDNWNAVFSDEKEVLKEDFKSDPTLVADLRTETTTSGVQVGDWEIKKLVEDGIPKYNIVSLTTGKTILENVHTYMTAKVVVKYLNEGQAINSLDMKKILRLDEEMDMNFQEALEFKMRAKRTGKEMYEARSQYAKDKMIIVQAQIKRICEGVA